MKNIKLHLYTKEAYDFFSIASCVACGDIMYNELHDMEVQTGDVVMIHYETGEKELIKIIKIEYSDGTIWVDIL